MALTSEESKYTSLYYRLLAYRTRKRKRSTSAARLADCWLAPLYRARLPAEEHFGRRGLRASDDCGIDISIEEHAQLADWTGRQIRSVKRGAIPADLAPILERLRIDSSLWIDSVDSFGEWSRLVVANASRMAHRAQQQGRSFSTTSATAAPCSERQGTDHYSVCHGVGHCRALFSR